ncbi:MAG TPA: penicillin-binding protein 1C [Steroidobacteraceae bacterium]|nr:penicillin-binding protein 1C [Steroidobacteraceae bacterium]
MSETPLRSRRPGAGAGVTRRPLMRAARALVLSGVALTSALVLFLASPVQVPSFDAVKGAYVPSDGWLLDRNGVVIDSRRLRFDVRRSAWVPIEVISPALVSAIVAGEDRRFYEHGGIDARSFAGALRDELWRHRRRGASTITMQLASLLEHRHREHSLAGVLGKLEQMRMAISIARRWSRAQILEAYLNLIEYQGELQGIGAASAILAGKSPAGLTRTESVVLGALLPQPSATAEQLGRRACARAAALSPPIPCEALHEVARELIARTPHGAADALGEEHLAPVLAQSLLIAPGVQHRTTLEAGLQRQARAILAAHLRSLKEHNARDGAALVVDNATGEVLAYVGSGGPHSRAAAIDGVRALRQAGSTLKPFLYELALERRYLTAASLLADSPLSLETPNGVYLPQDYDHDYKGLVSVRTALGSSLNVPAVRTLVLVGIEPFRDRLLELGYRDLQRQADFYGYSLALGSAEVTLWQQAQAYLTLARGGAAQPLTLTPASAQDETPPGTLRAAGERSSNPTGAVPAVLRTTLDRASLLDRDASFVVSDILSDPGARAVTFGLDNHLDTPMWTAVKTGTSEDMRDNWCIGFSRRFTVAVWVGNFEGDSMREVSGVTGAAPVWRDLMILLHASVDSRAPTPPPSVAVRVTQFSPEVEPARNEFYLSGTAPDAAARITAVPDSTRPRIESPSNGMVLALDPDIPPRRQRLLIAVRGAVRGAHSALHLILNDEALGPARRGQLWSPRPGAWHLSLVDDQGQVLDRIFFTVRGPTDGRSGT